MSYCTTVHGGVEEEESIVWVGGWAGGWVGGLPTLVAEEEIKTAERQWGPTQSMCQESWATCQGPIALFGWVGGWVGG